MSASKVLPTELKSNDRSAAPLGSNTQRERQVAHSRRDQGWQGFAAWVLEAGENASSLWNARSYHTLILHESQLKLDKSQLKLHEFQLTWLERRERKANRTLA